MEWDPEGKFVWIKANYIRAENKIESMEGPPIVVQGRKGSSQVCNFARAAVAAGYLTERLVLFENGKWRQAFPPVGRVACYMLVEEPKLRYAPYIPPPGTVERVRGALGSFYKDGPLTEMEIEAAKRYSQTVGMKFNFDATQTAAE